MTLLSVTRFIGLLPKIESMDELEKWISDFRFCTRVSFGDCLQQFKISLAK
jgi:hypothetical protein